VAVAVVTVREMLDSVLAQVFLALLQVLMVLIAEPYFLAWV
jgi:hypothetical protein